MNPTNPFKNKLPASYWIASTEDTSYPALERDIETDIAIIGGGMVGIMTAYMLIKAGHKVTIFEKDHIVNSTSGNTTAKITSQHALLYNSLIENKGADNAKIYADSQQWAVEFIRQTIKDHQINCDFEEKSAYIFTQDASYIEKIKNEVDAAKKLGIDAHFVREIDLPFKTLGAVEFKNQGQFHPRKYLLNIADYFIKEGGTIYENTLIKDIDRGDLTTLTTSTGNQITARKVIVASHYPFTDSIGFYFARLTQERSYIIAANIKEDHPNAMYISAESPTRSLRTHQDGNQRYLLIAGENHKTGHDEQRDHYSKLYDFAREHYTVEDVPYWWSTQDIYTADDIPYIGNITRFSENVYVATGFKKWGMTTSHVAAKIISDLIIKDESPWGKFYSPYRNIGGKSILKLVEQNFQVAKDLIKGKSKDAPKDYDLMPGEGRVVEINGEKTGVYLHEDGKVYFVDTTCTHLGCELVFNNAEQSWDCPCHGSRFDYRGDIIHGPATRDL